MNAESRPEAVSEFSGARVARELQASTERQPGYMRHELPGELRRQFDELGLPAGYALIGGAARRYALKALTGIESPVRDVDVAAFAEWGADCGPAALETASRAFMPDDYAHGYGVKAESAAEYFQTRDFTLNEVLVVGGDVILTPAAEAALRADVIEPTPYAMSTGRLSDKLVVKAVLLASVLEETHGRAEVRGIRLDEAVQHTSAFSLALGLQKALDYGDSVGHRFLDKLIDYGALDEPRAAPTSDARLVEVAERWREQTWDFEFRGEAAWLIERTRDVPLAQLLWATAPEAMAAYDRYHDMAQRHAGKGRAYTDERYYERIGHGPTS